MGAKCAKSPDADSEEDLMSSKVGLQTFMILKQLGAGSFSKVFLVKHKVTKDLYAMKSINKTTVERLDQVNNTIGERHILENTKSCPFIVDMKWAFQTGRKLYIVMELMLGGELYYHLRMYRRFDEMTAKFYLGQVILAFEVLHSRNVIYRDLKPENILMDASGYIKVTDFGLSKNYMGSTETRADSFVGTAEYFAPEVITSGNYTKAIDFWALGILLFEMLAGNTPFQALDNEDLFNKICHETIVIPDYFSDSARSLIKELVTENIGERLQDFKHLKAHAFFENLDWKKLQKRELKVPITPMLQNGQDLRYFDKQIVRDQKYQGSEINDTVTQSNQYPDYTYNSKNDITNLPSPS